MIMKYYNVWAVGMLCSVITCTFKTSRLVLKNIFSRDNYLPNNPISSIKKAITYPWFLFTDRDDDSYVNTSQAHHSTFWDTFFVKVVFEKYNYTNEWNDQMDVTLKLSCKAWKDSQFHILTISWHILIFHSEFFPFNYVSHFINLMLYFFLSFLTLLTLIWFSSLVTTGHLIFIIK